MTDLSALNAWTHALHLPAHLLASVTDPVPAGICQCHRRAGRLQQLWTLLARAQVPVAGLQVWPPPP